jgi:hypothetical protein
MASSNFYFNPHLPTGSRLRHKEEQRQQRQVAEEEEEEEYKTFVPFVEIKREK